MERGDLKLKDMKLSYDVTIEIKATPKLLWKVFLAIFKGGRLRIRHTFLNNPFYRHQEMTLNEFYKMAYLDDGWQKNEIN